LKGFANHVHSVKMISNMK